MPKCWLISLLILCQVGVLGAQDRDNPSLSLLTASPGKDLYTLFGHTALRVQYPGQDKDLVYNYGVFDFDTPGFYTKFVQGRLPYRLAVGRYEALKQFYQKAGQQLVEQPLQLNPAERQAILQFLAYNNRPENRYYAYDFFYDNCATRIRDLLEDQLPLSYPADTTLANPPTLRQMLHEYVDRPMPWVGFGFDLALGQPADKEAGFRIQMFLPDYLAQNLSQASLGGHPLLGKPSIRVAGRAEQPSSFSILHPSLFLPLLCVLLALGMWLTPLPWQRGIAQSILLLFGLAGLFLAFLWWGTDHGPVKQNWNLLWLNPLFLLLLLARMVMGKNRGSVLWQIAGLAIVVVALCGWILPQEFPLLFIPLQVLGVLACWKLSRS